MHNLQMLNGIGGKISALIERGANLGHIYRNCTEVKGKHQRRLEMNCTRADACWSHIIHLVSID